MEEVKISKKSKVGILPFVVGFEDFAELAETIFRNAERRGDLDKAYVKLINAVFMNGKIKQRLLSNDFTAAEHVCDTQHLLKKTPLFPTSGKGCQ